MYVPGIGQRIPRRGTAVSRALGRSMLGLARWHFEGTLPDVPKFVMIIAPHTSNWDFFIGLWAMFAIGFRISFLGKHTMFNPPLGPIMRWIGGIPVDRATRADRVAAAVASFERAEQLILVVAPEGTRRRVDGWKSGFYRVAEGAGVPIVPVAFDFGRRVVSVGEAFTVTGDHDADMVTLRALYRGVTAVHPENTDLS
ncbi:MAG: lysophospholipid acyltransferase family protein [Gemmatimonadaceae bacterium]